MTRKPHGSHSWKEVYLMADRILLIPGSPTGPVASMFVPQEMIEALLAISEIPIEQIDALVAALERELGFPSPERLSELVRQAVKEDRRTSAVLSALHNVPSERVQQVIQTIREWRERDDRNAELFPQEALARVEEKLPRLIRDFPALERCRKARRLASMLGNSAQALELICDIRPVFNAQRDLVEGMMPLTTMKIVYEAPDEETRVLEVQFSREMLNELVEKAQKAQQKLDVLNRSIADWTPSGLVDLQ